MDKLFAIAGDLQYPFLDMKAWKVFLEVVKSEQPDGVILNGDILDFYQISNYPKDPKRSTTIDKDLEGVKKYILDPLQFINERWWMDGNHDQRLERYLIKNAPALKWLPKQKAITIPNLLNLHEEGWVYKPYGDYYQLGKLWVLHGFMVRQHSGLTARAHFDRLGTSVIINHTHRLGTYYSTNARGPHISVENGCLCLLKPDWMQYPNWQQGFSLVHFNTSSGFFNIQQLPILQRKVVIFGKRFYGKDYNSSGEDKQSSKDPGRQAMEATSENYGTGK